MAGETKAYNYFDRMGPNMYPEFTKEGFYDYMLNGVKNIPEHGGVLNEGSTIKGPMIPDKLIGDCYIERRDRYVVLFQNGEVGYFNVVTEKYERLGNLNAIIKADKGCGKTDKGGIGCELDFSGCEYIKISHKFWNSCNELHIEFSLKCVYYTVNLDEFADEKRRAAMRCSDLLTFKCDCVPIGRTIAVEGSGANLPNGSYSFCYRLVDKDGHPTNWLNPTNEVSVGSGKNKPGEISNQYVQLHVEALDCRYGTIEIVVVKRIGDSINAYVVEQVHYNTNGLSYEYRGDNGRERFISLEELTTRRVNYLQGRGLKVYDGRTFYFQIRNTKNLDGQKYANAANLAGVVYKIPSKEAHKYSGYQPGERYIFSAIAQYCDATESAAFPFTGGGGLESRSSGGNSMNDGTGGESGSNVDFDQGKKDEYKNYDDLPKDHHVVQTDAYYTDGCVTGDDACEDNIKSHLDENEKAADELPDDNEGDECVECGSSVITKVKTFLGKLIGGLFGGISISINKSRKNKGNTSKASKVKEAAQKLLKELKKEEVFVPERVKVKITNPKTQVKGGSEIQWDPKGTFGDQYDSINVYKVGEVPLNWVPSSELYPMTKDCMGENIYGGLAGTPVMMVEFPFIKFFESNTVVVKSSKSLGVDETEGYVFMLGLKVTGLITPPLEETGKPLCAEYPWKIGMIARDYHNSRIQGSGILIHTFAGESDGRPVAVPKNGVNGPEYIDRYLQNGGDDHNHEGHSHGLNIYTFLGSDTLFAKKPLVANKFIKLGELSGDGYRHDQYAEGKKAVGFFNREIDQKGTRQTVSLHSYTPGGGEFNILGISYAKANKVIEAQRGIDLPLMNLNRESSVVLQLDGNAGIIEDKSFIADGLDHFGPVLSARAAYGYLVREMDNQYGSLVNARYIATGLYIKGGSRSVEGLVGDSHAGWVNIRRTSYISNLVGNRTFIPSPRKTKGIARFFGFGDPTEPPESGDVRDPKNRANRHENKDILVAAGEGAGTGSWYYPGVQKTLLWFPCQSRCNAYYRQRGDLEGEVHAHNLGHLSLDPSVPKGGHWETSWLTRFYKEMVRISKFLKILVPFIRIFIIVGLPLLVLIKAIQINSIADIASVPVRVGLYLVFYGIAIWVLSPSRLFQMLGVKAQLNDKQGGADFEELKQFEDNFCEIGGDYSPGRGIALSIGMSDPYNVCDCDDCSEQVYYRPGNIPTFGTGNRVYYSATQYPGTEINAARHVLTGDYKDTVAMEGDIQELVTYNNNLYAFCSDRVYGLSYNGTIEYRNLDYLLGNGKALGQPAGLLQGVPQGFAGTVDPNAIAITPYGVVYVDGKGLGVNIFNGSNIERISDYDVHNLFSRYLGFCNGNTCRDQKSSGVWYTIGFDPEYDRILFTKKDGVGGGSFTLSYYPKEKAWVSLHSYIPNIYLWSRNKMFSVADGSFWTHNDKKSKQIIYGKYQPWMIIFTAVNLQDMARYASPMDSEFLELHTEGYDIGKDIRNVDYTFNKGAWLNSKQFTGMHLLDTKYYQCMTHKDVRDKKFVEDLGSPNRGVWRINAIRDNILSSERSILSQVDCQVLPVLNEGNAVCKGGDGDKSNFSDYYMKHIYILDDPKLSGLELRLIRVITYGKKLEN